MTGAARPIGGTWRRARFRPGLLPAGPPSLGSYPAYFDRLTEVNRRGSAVLTEPPSLPELDAGRVKALPDNGGYVVDVRPAADYAAGHIPGALSIPLRDLTFAGRRPCASARVLPVSPSTSASVRGT